MALQRLKDDMQIPKSIKIGRKSYSVSNVNMRGQVRGKVYPDVELIELRGNDPYVFWHEVTHAILHDMGANWKDEKFVIAFSKRLNQAIQTARF
jgi:hypothetical protein